MAAHVCCGSSTCPAPSIAHALHHAAAKTEKWIGAKHVAVAELAGATSSGVFTKLHGVNDMPIKSQRQALTAPAVRPLAPSPPQPCPACSAPARGRPAASAAAGPGHHHSCHRHQPP